MINETFYDFIQNIGGKFSSGSLQSCWFWDGLMEYEHIYYNAAGEEMVGYFIYTKSEEMMRPGLVMFDGPWGGKDYHYFNLNSGGRWLLKKFVKQKTSFTFSLCSS